MINVFEEVRNEFKVTVTDNFEKRIYCPLKYK